MKPLGWLALLALVVMFATGQATAQSVVPPEAPAASAGQGAQTLEDILARQRGEGERRVPRDAATAAGQGAEMSGQLGTLGGASSSDIWEALRFGTADVRVSSSSAGAEARVLMQDRGMWWLELRRGPVATYGGYALIGMLVVLALFYAIKGKNRVQSGYSGRTVLRHTAFARFSHWLLASSFLILGITGLIVLFGRAGLLPWMGPEAFSMLALGSKWVHNNIAWPFMLSLVFILVIWTWDNLPDRYDVKWILKGGGILFGGHPSSAKFNAGEKIVFWSSIIFGAIISVSGLALLFPFEIQLNAWLFSMINATGLPEFAGFAALPERLSPHEEMQFSQLVHLVVAFVMMLVIMGHIFMGAFWIEGAMDGMISGRVDEHWAREHHDIWAEQLEKKGLISKESRIALHHGHHDDQGHGPKSGQQPAE